MEYLKLVELIPVEKREITADKLVDVILSSKHSDKMPSGLAIAFLQQWRQNLLSSKLGLSALLEGAILLEQEKTLVALRELRLDELVDRIKGAV